MKFISNLRNKNRKYILPTLFIFTVPLINIIYSLINYSNGSAYNLVTFLDNNIPFIKYFILPYNLWYPFLLTSLFYLSFKSRGVFYRTVISMDVGMVCCYIIYLLFQTTVPRPELVGGDMFTKLVGLTYKIDRPYNCFPSIHVLTSYLLIKGYKADNLVNKAIKIIIYSASVTIILATLFVKQHVVLDAASAVVLGDILFYSTRFIDEEMVIASIKKLYSLLTMKKKLET